MEIFTIGFTQKSAAEFFEALKRAGIKRVIDVRLKNRSQLAGFTKSGDVEYFLAELCGADYRHMPTLSPTKDILDAFKKGEISWDEYQRRFLPLLIERDVERDVDRALFEVPAALLCSEPTAECCHRRLVAEYLASKWQGVRIVHL